MTDPQSPETLDPQDWPAMRALAHRAVDDALDFIQNARERPVWQAMPPELAARFSQPLPRAPESSPACTS